MDTDNRPSEEGTDARGGCRAESVEATKANWALIKDDVMPFQRRYFGLEDEDLSYAFEDGVARVAVLRDLISGHVVGFTYAEPLQRAYRQDFHPERQQLPDAFYVQNTAIHPDYVGRGLVWNLHDQLHSQLRADGIRFVERDAMVENGYAARIERHYREAIIFAVPHVSRRGDQVYFRIGLHKTPIAQA